MHETLFGYPATLARYRAAPLLPERERFLAHCDKQGYTRRGLRKIAWLLLVILTPCPTSSARSTTLSSITTNTPSPLCGPLPPTRSSPNSSDSAKLYAGHNTSAELSRKWGSVNLTADSGSDGY
jgi:hypothetical protein